MNVIRSILVFLLCLGCTIGAEASKDIHSSKSGFKLNVKLREGSMLSSVAFCIRTGAVTEDKQTTGYSKLLSSLAFVSSKKFESGAFKRELVKNGIKFNCAVTDDFTMYTLTGPVSRFEKMIELGIEGIYRIKITDELLKPRAAAQRAEINYTYRQPESIASKALLELAFTKHPYKNRILGTDKSINAVTAKKLTDFHKKYYLPSNTWVSAVGNITLKKLGKIIDDYSYGLSKAAPDIPPLSWDELQTEPRTSVATSESNYTYTALGWPVPGTESSDRYPLYVMAEMLGGVKGGMLSKTLVDEDKLAYSAGSAYYESFYPMVFQIAGVTVPGKAEVFIASVKQIIRNMAKGEIDENLLEEAKNRIIVYDAYKMEDIEWESMNTAMYFFCGMPEEASRFSAGIRDVTADDIKRIANGYFDFSRLNCVKIHPASAEMDGSPEMITMDNGVRLIIKENHDTNVVAGSIKIAAGSAYESVYQDGAANLIAALLPFCAVPPDGRPLDDVLNSLGVSYSIGISHSYVTIDFMTMAHNLRETLNAIVSVLKTPLWDDKDLDKAKKKIYAAIEKEDENIYSYARKKILYSVFSSCDSARSVLGSKTSLEKLFRKDLKNFHKKFYIGRNVVAALAGDLYSIEYSDYLIGLFDGFSSSADPGAPKSPKALTKSAYLEFKHNKNPGAYYYAVRCISELDGRSVALDVLQRMLCDDSESRLKKRLRNIPGFVTLTSEHVSIANEGCFIIGILAEPQALDEISKAVKEEISKLCDGGFTDSELNLAKDSIRLEHLFKISTNKGNASVLAVNEVLGRGFVHSDIYNDKIEQVSRDDINSILNHFRSKIIAEVVIKP